MPTAGDAYLVGGALPLTHNPLQRIGFTPQKLIPDIGDILAALEAWIETFLFPAIEELTGIDLSAFLAATHSVIANLETIFGSLNPESGVFDPQAALQAMINLLIDLGMNLPMALIQELGGFSSGVPILPQLLSAITGSSTTGGGGLGGLTSFFSNLFGGLDLSASNPIIAAIDAAVSSIPGVQNILDLLANGLGLSGTGHTFSDVLGVLGNLSSLLGSPNLGSGFNPIAAGEQMLQQVLTPAGALTSFTQIPTMLFGGIVPGAITNLIRDPFFTDPSALDGLGLWNRSSLAPTTDLDGNAAPPGAGSFQVAADGSHQQLISLPFPIPATGAVDLNTIMAGAKVLWSGLVGTGDTMLVAVDSYTGQNPDGSMIQPPIADPNRVVAKITNPTTNSSAFTGADIHGWVPVKGGWLPPAGGKFGTLSFEVLSAANAGTVNFATGLFDVPNLLDASRLANVENIPQLLAQSVKGFQDVADLVGTFGHLFDGLGTASSGTPQSGLSFADLFALIQNLAFNADMGGSQGAINTNVLGIRINKSVGAGANSTSEAMHPIGLFGSGGTMTTTGVAAGNALSQTFRASEVAKKGFFEFIASAPAGTSNVFTNIYSVDPSTGNKTKLWGSNDIASLIGTGLNYVKSLIPGGVQPTINAGQNLLLEIANGSTNTLTVVTRNTGQPTHPTDFPKNLGATRVLASTGGNSPTSLTDAQITYTANHPYVNLGIANVPAGYVAPSLFQTPATAGTYTWTRPGGFSDGDLVDVFVLGAGGGGGAGGYGLSNQGAMGGNWTLQTFVIGSDPNGTGLPILPNSTTTLTCVVGSWGTGGVNPFALDPGNDGQSSTVSGAGITTLTATGGKGGGRSGNTNPGTGGMGPGNRTIADYTAFGGPDVSVNSVGSYPGGGGGSGYPASGSGGNVGKVWIRTRQQ
jgi:hypothetical protein